MGAMRSFKILKEETDIIKCLEILLKAAERILQKLEENTAFWDRGQEFIVWGSEVQQRAIELKREL